MIQKTYGVVGLMDWTTQIKAGKATVSVHFTGGALTAYGVTPAKYTTANKFFQSIIEHSSDFASGRIVLLSSVEVPDDAATIARNKRKAASASKKAEATDGMPAGVTVEVSEADDDAEKTDDNLTKVEVADKNEAIEYLKEHFDGSYTATQLRTKTAFEAACKAHGIEFVFTA